MTIFACCDYRDAFLGMHNGFYFYILISLDCVARYNEYSLFWKSKNPRLSMEKLQSSTQIILSGLFWSVSVPKLTEQKDIVKSE